MKKILEEKNIIKDVCLKTILGKGKFVYLEAMKFLETI